MLSRRAILAGGAAALAAPPLARAGADLDRRAGGADDPAA